MKVLIAHHRWWYPSSISGADIANHEFARRFIKRGIEVRVNGIPDPHTSGKTRRRNYVTEGVTVSLVPSDFIKQLSKTIREYKPDIVLTSSPELNCGVDDIYRMMDLFKKHSLPVVLYVHDTGGTLPLFEAIKHRLAAIVTNSHFMAKKIESRWKIKCEVVYPVPSQRVVSGNKQETGPFITFFNPVPQKGLNVAHSLVMRRFPERPFLFVEGFIDPETYGISLFRSGNLVHARRTPNVATIYMLTKTIIIPSQWEEPFGRVAIEAMYNNIPVIASKTGGLIESVGSGGILIDDFSSVDKWVEAIKMLDNPKTRKDLIEAGVHHAKLFSHDEQMQIFIDIFKKILR